MKRLILITAVLALTSVLAFAKVNISGEFVTQWRAQQMDQRAPAGSDGEAASRKVYEVETFDLIIDAQVSDRVIAFARIEFSGAELGASVINEVDVAEAWIEIAFGQTRRPDPSRIRISEARLLNLRMGKFNRPFGEEDRGVFAKESIAANANNALADTDGTVITTDIIDQQIVGAMISGDIDMLSYAVYVANTAIRSIGDTEDPAFASDEGNKNGKVYGIRLKASPIDGFQIGADYELGTYGLTPDSSATLGWQGAKARRMTAWNINAEYDLMEQLLLRGEYARIKHNDLLPVVTADNAQGAWGTAGHGTAQAKYAYYIVEGTYHGLKDWGFGARVSDIQAKSEATENAAGYSRLRQYQYAVQYDISANTYLKGEFAQRRTQTLAANPAAPRDHVYIVQLGVEF